MTINGEKWSKDSVKGKVITFHLLVGLITLLYCGKTVKDH